MGDGAGGDGADEVGGMVGGCVGHFLWHLRMCRRRYRGDHWSVGVRQLRDALAKMGGGPSRRADLEAPWRGGGGARPVGTSISHSRLRESNFAGSQIGQSGLWVYPGLFYYDINLRSKRSKPDPDWASGMSI